MALPSESSGGATGGWVAPWSYKPAPAPVTPPSFVGPVAPKKYVYAPPATPRAPAPSPARPLTPDQKALALARQIANAMPGQTKAALNAGIDLVASLVPSLPTPEFTGSGGGGTSFDMPQPQPPALPDFRQEYGNAVANLGRFGASLPTDLPAPEPPGAWSEVDPTPTYRLTRGLGADGPSVRLGSLPKMISDTPDSSVDYTEGSLRRIQNQRRQTPEELGARSAGYLPMMMAQPFIGPVAPKSNIAAPGIFGQGQGQGAAAATPTPPGVQAVMPPETAASGSRSYGSGSRSYAPRSYSSRSYVPRSYSSYSSSGGATAAATDFSGLPPAYTLAFSTAFNMPIEGYYTAERGGATQAARDYQNVMNLWQARTGKPMTPEELVRLLTSFDAYTLSLGRNPGWEDFVSYITMMTERQYEPQPVNVSYLGMGNI